ncbi:LysR family transcriptional regulator [Thalassomonas actiniarum]|uniref:LysR family transcriptional regulator n=1 Tax=Thalassomonas actiniarum TaxID=485447 RepID=A0AAE9YVJ7_9GAMM|nr:LysR family transcriptional regulator [Thalassomonas actiniarum]WDE01119.1 LysR family transcriptional regulator [Thalassomonas actiniarum]
MKDLSRLMLTFAQVVKTGSFTGAAGSLSVSKSVVSKQISALEAELDIALFYRNARKLQLTEAGERLYPHCQSLDRELHRALAAVKEVKEELIGKLSVTLPASMVIAGFGDILRSFQQQNPEVDLHIHVSGQQVDVIDQGVDLALRVGQLKDSELICKKLTDCHYLVCASPAYLAEKGDISEPEQLAGHNCLIYTGGAFAARWPFRHSDGKRVSVKVTGNLHSNEPRFLVDAVLAGQGVMFGPSLLFNPFVSKGQMVPLLADFSVQDIGFYGVYPKGAMQAKKARLLLDFIIEYCQKL